MSDACIVDEHGNYIETLKMRNKKRLEQPKPVPRTAGHAAAAASEDCEMPDPMRVSQLEIKPSGTYITPDFRVRRPENPAAAFLAALLQTEDNADQVAPDPVQTSEQDNSAVPDENFNPDEGLDVDRHNIEEEGEDDEEEPASKRQRHSSSNNGAASSSSNA